MTAPENALEGDGVSRLAELATGNTHLVQEPGLLSALFQGNATAQQAGAINQFLGGLKAEQAVRAAAAAGTKINLSDNEQSMLGSLGIDYSQVLQAPVAPKQALQQQMAAKGVQPVTKPDGTISTDAKGNPHVEPLNANASLGVAVQDVLSFGEGNGGFLDELKKAGSDIGHAAGSLLSAGQDPGAKLAGHETVAGAATDVLNRGYNLASSYGSQAHAMATDPAGVLRAGDQEKALAAKLGYDPNSTWSMLDFRSKGYAFNDTSKIAAQFDAEHPQGLMGLDGSGWVTEAEAHIDDPNAYVKSILSDPKLTPEQAAAKVKFVSSPAFQGLVSQVERSRQSIGTDVANLLTRIPTIKGNVDPVHDPGSFTKVANVLDTVATMSTDPVALGLGAYAKVQRASTAIKGALDSEGIRRVFYAGIEGGTNATAHQYRAQKFLQSLLDLSAQGRAAHEAGDLTKLAQVQAQASAHPLGALLGDFMGVDKIYRRKTALEMSRDVESGVRNPSPFISVQGAPITTYNQAVEYIASKNALLRLVGGKAPVEFSTMPGALSNYAFSRLRGAGMSWSAERTLRKIDQAASDFVGKAEADPAFASRMIDEGKLTRVLPAYDDAVDVLSGKVLAAKERVDAGVAGADTELASAKRALEDRQAEIQAQAPLAITPAGRGAIRRNQLDFGVTSAETPRIAEKALERAASDSKIQSAIGNAQLTVLGLPGTAQRFTSVVSRMTNQLPRDLVVNVENGSDAEKIRALGRTYLTPGDADMLAALWTSGTQSTRKMIAQGLREQVFHAAGLSRTAAGRELIDRVASGEERYSVTGQEWLDRNGVAAGQTPGQMQTEFRIPNFGAVHKAAAKIGLFEATMGRLLNSGAIDRLMQFWRTSVLGSQVTANRAIAEAMLAAHVDRDFGIIKSLAAKSVLRDNGLLQLKGLHRWRVLESLAGKAGFRDVGRAYRYLLQQSLKPEELQALRSMPLDVAAERLFEQSRQHWEQLSDPTGGMEAREIANAGLHPVVQGYDTREGFDRAIRKRTGYEVTDEVDGQAGANSYAFTLGAHVNGDPAVARAELDHIEFPGKYGIEHVVEALDRSPKMQDSLYGKVYRADGIQLEASTPEQIAEAKRQWAQGIVDDLSDLLTGRNAVFQKDVAKFIRDKGHAPDAEWLQDRVVGLNRPQKMIRPTYAAVHPELQEGDTLGQKTSKVLDAMQEWSGKIYQLLVERPIQRNGTSPLYGLAYAKTRVGLEPLKAEYMAGGLSEEAAERLVGRVADRVAFNRVALMVDNPSLKLQMDVASRAFFAFSRATTSMLRRWATIGWKNPAQARRLQLAYESAEHSGIIYPDPTTGEPLFLLPVTGVAQEFLFHLMSNVPGLQGMAAFPYSDFQGRLASIIPGSNNPFQYNTTPFVSISGRRLASLIPNHRELFDEIDAKLNGSQGQGQGVWATFAPRLVKQFSDAELADGRNSVMNSAMVGALMNLGAAGLVPKDGASPAEIEQFLSRLKVGTQSTLGVRFLLGMYSPASMLTPEGNTKSDFAFASAGVKSMHDEFTALINDTGGDYARALAIWTYLHPDMSIFTQAKTQGLTKNANIAATHSAYQWMASHAGFIDKYKSVSAYFVPPAKPGEGFDMQAYRAQVEMGFRERKTPQEFIDSWRTTSAMTPYYTAEADYQSKLAAAQAAGQDTSQMKAQWSAWSQQFKAQHPTFAAYLSGAASNAENAFNQFNDLKFMVKNGDVPGTPLERQAVTNMVNAYEGYRAAYDAVPGQSNAAQEQRKALSARLSQFFTETVTAVPSLKDLANGVFHTLDHNITYMP